MGSLSRIFSTSRENFRTCPRLAETWRVSIDLRIRRSGTPRLSAAHELDDLELRTLRERRGRPVGRLDDAAIEFYGHTRRVQVQRFEQLENSLPARHRAALAVNHDLDGPVG